MRPICLHTNSIINIEWSVPIFIYQCILIIHSEFPMVNRSEYTSKPKKRNLKTTRTEMSHVEKGRIIGFFHCLRNIALVAQIIGWPWSTIKSFLTHACEYLSLDDIPRLGHTPILSQQQRNTIIWAAKSNRKMTRWDFRDRYTPGVSLSTGSYTLTRVIGYDFLINLL